MKCLQIDIFSRLPMQHAGTPRVHLWLARRFAVTHRHLGRGSSQLRGCGPRGNPCKRAPSVVSLGEHLTPPRREVVSGTSATSPFRTAGLSHRRLRVRVPLLPCFEALQGHTASSFALRDLSLWQATATCFEALGGGSL